MSPLVHTRRFALEQRCNRGGAFASRPHRSEQPVFFRCPRRPGSTHFFTLSLDPKSTIRCGSSAAGPDDRGSSNTLNN